MMLVRTVSRIVALCALAACLGQSMVRAVETFDFHHEHVLGTSLQIQVQAPSEAVAQEAEGQVLAEIKRLADIFSTYDAGSEFSRWQAKPGVRAAVSPELLQVLAASDRWRELSHGAFNPAVDVLSRIWQAAQQRNQLPTGAEIASGVAQARSAQWSLDPASGTATRLTSGPLSLNAIAKGAIVDGACEIVVKQLPVVTGVLVNIGGDLRSCGQSVASISITDPANDAINASPATTIFVRNQGVATSGNYHRGFEIVGQWYSHVIDPRTGHPVKDVVSATAVAETAADADALATIFSALSTDQSIALAESLQNVECLLLTADGRRVQSQGWAALEQPRLFRAEAAAEMLALADAAPNAPSAEASVSGLLDLVVEFEINRPGGQQLRRPYLAVWLEDENQFPVKTAVLWMQTKSPGPRWHRDLIRWYRNDNVRKLADNTELIGTVSSATRGPGKYKAVFDGKDDAGNALKPGKYTLFIEVAREHGTYQLIRHPLTLGSDPIEKATLKNNVEIKSATVEYRARQAQAAASSGN